MKIALASAPVLTRDVEHNIASIQRTLAQCGGKADLVVFGECNRRSIIESGKN